MRISGIWFESEMKYSRIWSPYAAWSVPFAACASMLLSSSSSTCRCFRLRLGIGEGERSSSSIALDAEADGPGLLRMGDGVRELEEASEGEGVIVPSSEPRTDSVSTSEPSPSCPVRFEDRVLIGISPVGSPPRRMLALEDCADTRCFGANGGLFASGWKSMIGFSATSQPYCRHRTSPRSRGIQVPWRCQKELRGNHSDTED